MGLSVHRQMRHPGGPESIVQDPLNVSSGHADRRRPERPGPGATTQVQHRNDTNSTRHACLFRPLASGTYSSFKANAPGDGTSGSNCSYREKCMDTQSVLSKPTRYEKHMDDLSDDPPYR